MGVGYIPYSEITSYLNENKVYMWEERECFRRMIVFIDGLYMKNQNKESNKNKNKSKTK